MLIQGAFFDHLENKAIIVIDVVFDLGKIGKWETNQDARQINVKNDLFAFNRVDFGQNWLFYRVVS
jgi:hypothetical protein